MIMSEWADRDIMMFDELPAGNYLEASSILVDAQKRVARERADCWRIPHLQVYEHDYMFPLIAWILTLRYGDLKGVLDLGCGWGTALHVSTLLNIPCFGIDCLAYPSEDYPTVICNFLDISSLEFVLLSSPIEGDLVICNAVLEHIRFDPRPGLKSVLGLNTRWLYLATPGEESPWDHTELGRGVHYRDFPQWSGEDIYVDAEGNSLGPTDRWLGRHVKSWSLNELRDLCDDVGFSPIGYRATPFMNMILAERS